jgi:CheY-like chemotaxis protein
LRLLLVDDHEDTLDFMTRLLRARGHDVTTAKTVAEAASACSSHNFDLAICDLQLPDGTGEDLLAKLRTCGTPAIALSGHASPEDQRHSQSAGFVAHLTKPIALDALEKAIKQAVPGSPKR